MPIDAQVLREKGVEVTAQLRGHRQEQVIDFMRSNHLNAYTQSEVANALTTEDFEMKPQQARQVLHALMKKDPPLVERRELQDGDRRKIFYAWSGPTPRTKSAKTAKVAVPASA